ncbi:MAG: adenylosuccinate synthase [Myxococcota bacterium]
MSTLIIVGAQWGDEGKGKVVDLLAERAEVVVRYAGGPNAGHTLVVGDDKIVLRLTPSGVLHPHTRCVLGPGMVINPSVLLDEIETLTSRGVDVAGRLFVSDRAHLILPFHIAVDTLREEAATGTKIGTTKRGIGPCYEDKVGRRGLRIGDLRRIDHARTRVSEALRHWAVLAEALGGAALPSIDEVMAPLETQAQRLLPYLADTGARLEAWVREKRRIMLEGAQGTMLDVDHGTYPYVTSSSAVAGGACTGGGIGPSRVDRVVGITKAYTTRVGEGPFPTELSATSPGAKAGQHLRDAGGEYGSVTGRPRRTGWLDLAGLRFARRVNGLDALAVTKLDVLRGLPELSVCVGYRAADGTEHDVEAPAGSEPIYRTFPGFQEDLSTCRRIEDLPGAARTYLDFISVETGLPIDLVSVGPRRRETIAIHDSFGSG